MLQIYFTIDHHLKTQSELTDMLKNSPNSLNVLQGDQDGVKDLIGIGSSPWEGHCIHSPESQIHLTTPYPPPLKSELLMDKFSV